MEIENRQLAGNLRDLSNLNGGTMLQRECLDFETCYWAHRESQIASLVFVMAFFVFLASSIFTFARIFGIDGLEDAAFWAAAPSTFGAVLASFHLCRKLSILNGLQKKVANKKSKAQNSDSVGDYSIVISATRHQIFLTVNRLITAVTAAIVLPFALAISAFETDDNMMEEDSTVLPSRLAAISVVAGIFSLVYFFLVEYIVRYNLPLELGPFICRVFQDEILETFVKMRTHSNGVDSPLKENNTHWEYTARQFLHTYRFDTVFAADRFGQILQAIQGGLLASQKIPDHTLSNMNEEDAESESYML